MHLKASILQLSLCLEIFKKIDPAFFSYLENIEN